MEIIKKITEVSNVKYNDYTTGDGYEIITTDQVIKILIDNGQSCCESWGYFITNDNADDFVGAKLINITITDQCLVTEKAPNIYEGGIMFVNVETDKGVLQFTAFNAHNGYYGHTAVLLSNQLNYEDVL